MHKGSISFVQHLHRHRLRTNYSQSSTLAPQVFVSVDISSHRLRPEGDSLFLHVKPGMTVVVSEGDDWWIGDVLYCDGGARDPNVPTLFQIADVDSGVVRWVNADLVSHVVPKI